MRPRLVAIFSGSIVADLTQKALGLANSVLLVKFLGPAVAGQYFLMIAALGAVPGLLNAFDQVLTRFLPVSEGEHRTLLSVATLLAKLYTCLACALAIVILWRVVPGRYHQLLDGLGVPLLVAGAFCFGVLALISSWCNRVLAAYQDYRFQIAVDIAQALFTTVWLVIALTVFEVAHLENVVYGIAVVTTLATVAKLMRIPAYDRRLPRSLLSHSLMPRWALRAVVAERYRSYLLPFLLTSLSGFLKEHFPLLVVGALAEAKVVAEFRVIQQIFRTAHSIVPNAFERIRPGLVLKQANGPHAARFTSDYQRYARGYLFASTLFAVGIVLLLGPVLSIWSLHASIALYAVATLFGVELLFGSAAHVEYQIFLLEQAIGYLTVISIVRQIITSVVIVVAGAYFGQVGVALGAGAGALYTWLAFIGHSLRTELRPKAQLHETIVLSAALALVIALAGGLMTQLN